MIKHLATNCSYISKHSTFQHLLLLVSRYTTSSDSLQRMTAANANIVVKPLEAGSAARRNFEQIIATPEIQLINDIFQTNGHELRIAGGAVRDLLVGSSIPHDIDFATTATPSQMINFLSPHQKDIRLITTRSGEKHGTITARIKDSQQYEITTLRIDKKTDGRHAEVEFIQDWVLDSARRDLTINAMFLDFNGNLHDYFNGAKDLENKLIRFVGNPGDRIREDYLRILRYFRFYCRYGTGQHHDPPTIEAIKENLDGLKGISGERLWTEMKRILVLPSCTSSIVVMFKDLTMSKYMGFANAITDKQIDEFKRVHKLIFDPKAPKGVNSMTLFTALLEPNDIAGVVNRLKLSNSEAEIGHFVLENRGKVHSMRTLKRNLALGQKSLTDSMKRGMVEYLYYMGRFEDVLELQQWKIPEFPFKGHLLRGKVDKPRHVGVVLTELKKFWADKDYQMTDEECEKVIEETLTKLN